MLTKEFCSLSLTNSEERKKYKSFLKTGPFTIYYGTHLYQLNMKHKFHDFFSHYGTNMNA